LRPGDRVAQRFEVHANGLSEVHVRLEHYGGPCEVTAKLFQLASPDARVPIGSNALPCSNDGFLIVPVAGQRQSAGRTYELELSAAGASTPRLFHVAPPPAGFTPFVESVGGNANSAAPDPRVLAFRVVVDGNSQLTTARSEQ
jgi:hypothetical protein